MTNGGFNGFPSATAATAAATAAAGILPVPASGSYFFTSADAGTGTSSSLGTGTLHLVPWVVSRALSLARIGTEVTLVGDSGSKFRLGIYADSGSCYPGSLVVDAGQVAGDSATVQELTINVTLPVGLYWVGGAVQSVSVTQPTMRTAGSGWTPPVRIVMGTATPSAGVGGTGFTQSSVTGALPATFTKTVAVAATHARVFVQVA